jgi:hypothetical protein
VLPDPDSSDDGRPKIEKRAASSWLASLSILAQMTNAMLAKIALTAVNFRAGGRSESFGLVQSPGEPGSRET